MSKVYTGATMSIDGYISGPDESGFDHLFQWYGSGDVEMTTTHRATARARGRRRPDRGPRAAPDRRRGVRDVVLTHLHDDHSGSLVAFPRARFRVQDDELAFWTGRDVGRGAIGHTDRPGPRSAGPRAPSAVASGPRRDRGGGRGRLSGPDGRRDGRAAETLV